MSLPKAAAASQPLTTRWPARSGWGFTDLMLATGAPLAAGNPHSYAFDSQGTQHVNYWGRDDNHVYELWWDNTGWHYGDLTAATGAPLTSGAPHGYVFDSQGTQHVNYRGMDNHIYELWWDNSGWHYGDLTGSAGSPLATGEPRGYVFDSQGTQHVNYRGVDNHIYELWWDNSGWHYGDLTAATGAPLASGDPHGYVFDSQGTQHVIYRAVDNHIYELWWDNTGWHLSDLTAATGAPAAVGDPHGYVFKSQFTRHVNYRGIDNHVYELWWDNSGWHYADLTAATGTPVAAGDPYGYVFESQGTQHVNYLDAQSHVSELWWDSNGWHYGDLTATALLPYPAWSPQGYVFNALGTQQVNCSGPDGHVRELRWPPSPSVILQGINVTFQTHAGGDGKSGDTILHIFVKNRSSTTSTPETDTFYVANSLAFRSYESLGANELNPYLGHLEFAQPAVAFPPGTTSDPCRITLRSTPIPLEEINLPVVNVHILAKGDNTWIFDYTVDFFFSDSGYNFSFSSIAHSPQGIVLDQDKRDHSGICSENPVAQPPAPNPPMDPVLTLVIFDVYTNGDSKEASTKVNLNIVNRINATTSQNIVLPTEIAQGQQFDNNSLKTTLISFKTGVPGLKLQDIVLPVVYITIETAGADTWKFDYRVRFLFNYGSHTQALVYDSVTTGVVLNENVVTHCSVYRGNSFPATPPLSPEPAGNPAGAQSKPISLAYVNKKLNDFINSREGLDPSSDTAALIKVRIHNSGVIGAPNPASYYDVQSLDSDPPPPGFIANDAYRIPVKWDSSTTDLGQQSASVVSTDNYYFYDINSAALALTLFAGGNTPLALTVIFETDGQEEIQGGLLTTKFSEFAVGISLTLTYDPERQIIDLMSWMTDLNKLTFINLGQQLLATGEFLGQQVTVTDASKQGILTFLASQVITVTVKTNRAAYIENYIHDELVWQLLNKLSAPDSFSGQSPRDQINSFFNSWLLGGIIEGERGVFPADNACKVTGAKVDTSTNSLQIQYTGPNYTFQFDKPGDWPAGHDFSEGALANIDHIVVLTMENRSFDHMLGYLSLPPEKGGMGRTDVDGLKGNESNSIGTQVCLSAPLAVGETVFAPDPPHSFEPVQGAINCGKMDGFAQACAHEHGPTVGPNIMKYHPAANVPVYDALARDFALGHRWFACHPGPTFPNRFYELTGRPNIDPQGFWELSNSGPKIPVFTKTIFDWLSDAGVSWSYFEHFYCFLRFFQQHTFNTTNIFDFNNPDAGFASIAAAGKLPSVTFIDPHFIEFPPDGNCDGPPADVQRGQELVNQVVQAVVTSPDWNKTLLIITYDEHGGFFDHVPPPPAAQIAAGLPTTYGVRVPAFVISPWVAAGTVFGNEANTNQNGGSPLYFDHTSILKTIAKRFLSGNPPYMGERYAQANDLSVIIGNQLRQEQFLPFIPYNLLNSTSNKRLDVQGGSFSVGTLLWQYNPNDTVAQQFSFEDAGGGYYYLRTHTGNLYVTVDVPPGVVDLSAVPTLSIKQDVKYAAGDVLHKPDYQRWSFTPAVDGLGAPAYSIRNAAFPDRILHPLLNSVDSGGALALQVQYYLGIGSFWRIAGPPVKQTGGASIAPAYLTFDAISVGVTSTQQLTVAVTASPGSQLIINSIALLSTAGALSTGGGEDTDFACVPPPGSPPPAGSINIQDGHLVVTVFFHPVAAGTRNAALVISHNLANSPLIVTLSGVGN